MSETAVVAGRIDEARERRHEHSVDVGAIAGFMAAGDDWNVECCKEGVGAGDAFGLRSVRLVARRLPST